MNPNDPPATPAAGAAALTPLKRAFLALEDAQSRLAAMEQAAREPVAVIGLGCRVPGGGDDSASFWQLMRDGVDAIAPIPSDRWDAEALYDADPATPGRIATRAGGFLESIDCFDAAFFSISPREAQGMDPQQRLLLEVCWEALEHAGQAPYRLVHTSTGVYMGMCSSDYAYLQLKTGDPALLDAHFTSGIAHSILSGRISYLLGLQGPSLTVDTACSSSLVAVHLACQALRSGDCRMALAGGVNLILSPDLYIALSHSRMLAPDGRCKTFDAAADGFARAEGCSVVVLKRLSDALDDGDRVLAVIRGSAVNQDGPSSGLTAPNGPAQEAVIREALARSGLAPRQVGYVEAHGTGTQLGDPLEVHAIGAVFGADRDPDRPLLLGSVKTNIGHLEGAAGVTGLIKLVLSLQHRAIPSHLHFRNPSPHIAWADLPVRVPTQLEPWQPIDGRRIGGVSSFGFSGTNAHVVVEEAPAAVAATEGSDTGAARDRPACLFALSARDERALAVLAGRYAASLQGRADEELADICFTANAGRAHFVQRATIVARSIEQLRSSLLALAEGRTAEGLRHERVTRRDPPRIAFLFTGQGAQYPGMARGLYSGAPVFRAALDRCAELLAPLLARPLLDVVFPAEGEATPLDETAYTQPALFALGYALTELWRSWGIAPNVVVGHSVGEYGAACVAGVLDLKDALGLIAARGRLMQSLPAGGAMAALFAPEAEVAQAIAPHAARVSIGAVNGAEQTVISGAADAVAAVCERFVKQGVRCQPLTVSHAFHSPLVEPILDLFEREAAAVRLAPPRLRLVSNLTGRLVEAGEITRPSYWRRHAREAVRFGDGLRSLAALKPDCVIEIGPHPTLLSFAGAALGEAPKLIPSLRKGRADWEQLLDALASLYLAGAEVNWRGVFAADRRRIVDLPGYPFQRERFWFQAAPRSAAPAPSGWPAGHPLLGVRLRSAGSETIYESRVSVDAPGFVRQHRVLGRVVTPATAYLDTLLAAARERFGNESVHLEEVTIKEAMLLDDEGAGRTVQVVCRTADDGGVAASLSSLAEEAGEADGWTGHVTAVLRSGVLPPAVVTSLSAVRSSCTESLSPADLYAGFERRGLAFGDAFKSIRQLWGGVSEAVGEIELAPGLLADTSGYRMHPVLLDGCLQVLAAALRTEDEEVLYLPIGIGRYTLFRSAGSRCWSHVSMLHGTGESRQADVRVFSADGLPVAELCDVQLKRVSRDALTRLDQRWLDECLYETRWQAADATLSAVDPVPFTALERAGTSALPALHRSAGIEAYDRFLPRLEELCADYVVRAFDRLGWRPAAGETTTAAALGDHLGVSPNHRRLLERLLAILAEEGYLVRSARGWTVARPLRPARPEDGLAALAGEYPDGAAELEMTGRVAGELAEALRGERDPMQLLFPGGSLATAERLYRDTPTAKLYNGLMAEVMATAVGGVGAKGRPLRILEIGGGTGGTTAHLLPRLPAERVDYTFTDVGPLFVARARERFGNHAFMHFEVLDLEEDAQPQGFPAQAFDVIIASNVVHATTDLRSSLGRIRQLLVPGGLLAMLEVTAPQRWFDLTVGLTKGWWAFQDADLRPDYATMPRDRWLRLLAECGFDESAVLPAGDGHRGALALQSLLLARSAAATVALPAARNWLLFADQGGVAAALGERLRRRGDRCTLVSDGAGYEMHPGRAVIDGRSATDHRRLLEDLQVDGQGLHGVIHAWSLDAPPWESMTAAGLSRSQEHGVVSAMLSAQSVARQSGENPPPRLWIVSRGAQQADVSDRLLCPAQAPVWGLAKTIALEHPELDCVCVDLDPDAGPGDEEEIASLAAELDEPGSEAQVALRQSGRRIARLARVRRSRNADGATHAAAPWCLAPAVPGALDTLARRPVQRRQPGPDELEIEVHATGLNFKDVLNVLGMYPGDAGPLGGECAGRVTAVGTGVTHVRPGDDVLAVAGGSFASHVIARREFVQPRPAGLGAEEAASIPIAFLTAEFCLGHVAGMRRGDRVLIHAAAGGVGMAAVRLAQRAGAEVFATAGSVKKRELLRDMGVAHVFDSRSGAFAEEILARTGGQGVDLVLNSLSGEIIDASFRVLARGGRFVEIGKRGIKDQAWVDGLDKDLRYFIIDWGATAALDPGLVGDMLARLVDEVRQGRIVPLPRHVFGLDDVERAFRFMAQARHIGKIVVRHGPPSAAAIRRDGTYLVTGGLSGLGTVVARWLAERGAGRIVLVGRRGITPEAAPWLATLRGMGCDVLAESLDVTDEAALRVLLDRLRRDGPPLRGVIHGAGVLDDAALSQQDPSRFARVLGPKVGGGWLLDRLTRSDPLDLFVLFSSAASVLGAPGQANHAAANSFLDLLARERKNSGLPGVSVNWGAWTEVGAAAGRGVTERLMAQGLGALTPSQGLMALARLIEGEGGQVAVLPVDWRRYMEHLGGADSLAFLSDVRGTASAAAGPSAHSTVGTTVAAPDLRRQLEDSPPGRWRPMVASFVRERALRALGVDTSRSVDPRMPLGDLGLDSLLAVELRNALGSAIGRSLPATLLFDYPTIDALTDYLLNDVFRMYEEAGEGGEAPSEEAVAAGPSLVASIEELSDDEVDRQLAARAARGAR